MQEALNPRRGNAGGDAGEELGSARGEAAGAGAGQQRGLGRFRGGLQQYTISNHRRHRGARAGECTVTLMGFVEFYFDLIL